jgi:threonine dehydrogenase-like Zn-dependent dehydrogenase
MKANCWFGANNVQVTDVPDPILINPRDAIVRITSTAICGSDIHLLDGFIPNMEPGDILGSPHQDCPADGDGPTQRPAPGDPHRP